MDFWGIGVSSDGDRASWWEMNMRQVWAIAAGAFAAGLIVTSSPASAADLTATRQAAIDSLAGQLRQTVKLVPTGSNESAYESQLVAEVDQANVECAIAIAAVQEMAGMEAPAPAHEALAALLRRVARCGVRGTGAISGGGPAAIAFGPTLGGGGSANGSNYK